MIGWQDWRGMQVCHHMKVVTVTMPQAYSGQG